MVKPTILNVDDYEPARYARTKMLRDWGFDVKEARTGAEALRLATLEHPALVILDIHLPDIDGFEVCRRLKRDHDGATLPILHISATFTSGAHQALGLEGGADGYLVEPVEPAVLRATIDALLRMRRAERALRIAARQWEATFDGIADGIALVAHDLAIVRSNAAFRRMVGPAHETHQRLGDLWDEAADAEPPFVRVWKSAEREVGDVSRDGRWYRLTVDPVIEDGAVVSAVCFVSEVTEVRRLEHERQTRFDDARHARAEAEAANRAKDDFLAVLGHELRTPLMPIALSIRALHKKYATDPDVTRTREVIDRQVRHLTRLVDDLLDVARLTRQKLRLHLERLDLRSVVGDAIDATRQQIEARRHRLTVRLPEAPVWVEGDAVRLGQIVANLLTNAAKFTPAGGAITVTLERAGRDAVLRVSDNGVGIAAESLPLIFEAFAQAAALADPSERGLGIGLALVRGLAEAHGGGASVASDGPGRGSEFVVRLPLAAPDQPALALSQAMPAAVGARVLVVEDDADSRTLLAEVLRLDGHDVTATHDGAEAVTAAVARPPDIAIIDIGLRGMDGYEVARRLRQTLGGTIHLVAVTGYGQADDIERSRAAGFDAHVTKPVAPDELLRLLGGWPRR